MKYVEEMALRAWNECHSTNRCEGTIEQVIADTKRAHLKAIKPLSNFQSMNYSACVEAIEQAEIKAEGEV